MKKAKKKGERRNPDSDGAFLGLDGKTWLIIGGVAVAALIAWKVWKSRQAAAAPAPAAPRPAGALPPGVTGIVPRGVGAAPQAAPACPPTPQPVAEVGPEDEFSGGELL